MPTREEIREGIVKRLDEVFLGLDHWDCSEECGHKVSLIQWRDEIADELLAQLHSQGVVIKVDRDIWDEDRLLTMEEAQIYSDILKAGYVATEPLRKEGE